MDPEGRRLVGLVDSRDCGACTAAQEAGVIVLRSIADGEGNLEWFVMSPGPEALKEKVDVLSKATVGIRNCKGPRPYGPGMGGTDYR